MKTFVTSWNVYVPILLHYDPDNTNVSKSLKKRYLTYQYDNDEIEDLTPIMQMLTDGLFLHPTVKAARLHQKKAPTRLYHYTYKGRNSAYPAMRSYKPGTVNFGKISVAATYASSFVKNNIMNFGEKDTYLKWGKFIKSSYNNYQSLLNEYKCRTNSILGPVHGDDLFILFSADSMTEVGKGHADYDFSYNLVKTWAHFAKAS